MKAAPEVPSFTEFGKGGVIADDLNIPQKKSAKPFPVYCPLNVKVGIPQFGIVHLCLAKLATNAQIVIASYPIQYIRVREDILNTGSVRPRADTGIYTSGHLKEGKDPRAYPAR